MDQELVKHILKQHRISQYGFAPLGRPVSLDIYKEWLAHGRHGDMSYLSDHLSKKESPSALLPKARSAVVIAVPYPEADTSFPLTSLKIAKYARGKDYHYWLKEKVNTLARDLGNVFPENYFLGFTDSSPVLERDLAHHAGLGWFGKNSCLLSRAGGSYFLLAEIYTTLDLVSEKPISPDHCGTCTRCIDACPTGAILDNRTLDATKCISYWTIESKSLPPPEMAVNFSSWFFGCDICQDVCPWNGKIYSEKYGEAPSESSEIVNELRWILTSSNKELERVFKSTPLLRARGRGLKRNALIVAANSRLVELRPEVSTFLEHEELGPIARWSLSELSGHNV